VRDFVTTLFQIFLNFQKNGLKFLKNTEKVFKKSKCIFKNTVNSIIEHVNPSIQNLERCTTQFNKDPPPQIEIESRYLALSY
jgi:hypothetical protein